MKALTKNFWRIVGEGMFMLVTCTVFCSIRLAAQWENFKVNELSLGLGLIHSFEKDPFNIAPDYSLGSATGFLLSYLHNFDERYALGIHVFGFLKTTPSYTVTKGTEVRNTQFDINVSNIGLQGRMVFMRGRVEPYLYAMVNYSSGNAESGFWGKLGLNGFSLGGGGGVGILLAESFKMSLEGILSVGNAKWNQRPFMNSNKDRFNPSLMGILAIFSYIFD